jgi:hypothetical protein
MRMLTRCIVLTLLSLNTPSFAPPALAQNAWGSLSGSVVDGNGDVVVGAMVTAKSTKGDSKQATTDHKGIYVITGLEPGEYTVSASQTGFAAFEKRKLKVLNGGTTTFDIELSIRLEEQVTVRAESELSADPNNNMNQIVLSGNVLDALPDDPDDVAAALSAIAGTPIGSNGDQTYVNGFSGGRLPPKELIREIRVNQNPFSAAFDQPGFSRTEVFTKPGASQMHGQGFVNFTDRRLNTRNPFALADAPFQSRLYGGNVGGPVLSKKAAFFFDIERQELFENILVNAATVDPHFSVTPFRQIVSTPRDRISFSPRLDYQFNSKHALTFRYARTTLDAENTDLTSFTLPSNALSTSSREHLAQVTYATVRNSTSFNDLRFQYLSSNWRQEGDSSAPTINVLDAFVGGAAQVGLASRSERRWELTDDYNWARGLHTFRAGFRLRGVSLSDLSSLNFNGRYTFAGRAAPELDADGNVMLDATGSHVMTQITSIEQYRRTLLFASRRLSPAEIRSRGGGASQFFVATGDERVDVGQTDFGGFFQSDWRVRPTLTLSFGLRYEWQTNLDSKFNVGPRVAFVWVPGGGGSRPPSTVLRGGFGVFYDRFAETLTLHGRRYGGENQRQFILSDDTAAGLNALSYFPLLPPAESYGGLGSAQTVWRIADDLQTPYMQTGGIGVERRLPLRVTFTGYLVFTRRVHDLLARNLNAPTAAGLRPFGGASNIFQIESAGVTDRRDLMAQARYIGKKLTFFAVYVYGTADSTLDGPFSFPADSYDLSSEYGRASSIPRHSFNLIGSWAGPWGLSFSPLVNLRSGLPFNITTGVDSNHDGLFTERPALATDLTKPGVRVTPYGAFDPNPEPGQRAVPRNFGTGPSFFQVNLRVAKTFKTKSSKERPGRNYRATVSVQVQNLFNQTNLGPVVGNLSSPFFGEPTTIAGGFGYGTGFNPSYKRRVEGQLRLSF